MIRRAETVMVVCRECGYSQECGEHEAGCSTSGGYESDWKTVAVKEEPPPTKTNGAHIWDLVIEDMRSRKRVSKTERDAIIADMRARDRMGQERYKVPLQACNGRDPMVDAYQEILDYTVYLRQAIERGHDVEDLYSQALSMVIAHRDRMGARSE